MRFWAEIMWPQVGWLHEEEAGLLRRGPQVFQVEHWCSKLPFSIVSLKKRTPFMTTKLRNNTQDKEKKLLCWQASIIMTVCQKATLLHLLKTTIYHAWRSRKETDRHASVTFRHQQKSTWRVLNIFNYRIATTLLNEYRYIRRILTSSSHCLL